MEKPTTLFDFLFPVNFQKKNANNSKNKTDFPELKRTSNANRWFALLKRISCFILIDDWIKMY